MTITADTNRLCVNCEHYVAGPKPIQGGMLWSGYTAPLEHACHKIVSAVTGEPSSCESARHANHPNACGPGGLYFDLKAKK